MVAAELFRIYPAFAIRKGKIIELFFISFSDGCSENKCACFAL